MYNRNRYLKKIIIAAILLCIIFPLLTSCTGVWQDPNTSVPSREITITNILVTPNLYDGAGVKVEGKVWDLLIKHNQDNEFNDVTRYFKLADKDGNYVNVKLSSILPDVTEGDHIKVVGIHRLVFNSKSNIMSNEIEALRIER